MACKRILAVVFILVCLCGYSAAPGEASSNACRVVDARYQEVAAVAGQMELPARYQGTIQALPDVRGGGSDKFLVAKPIGSSVDVRLDYAGTGKVPERADFNDQFAGSYVMMPYIVGVVWFPTEGCWEISVTDGVRVISAFYQVRFGG